MRKTDVAGPESIQAFKMPHLDEDIASMRLKLAALEDQKRREAEVEAETKANPLKRIETNLTQTKKSIEYHEHRKQWHERIHACQRVSDLEPILEALKQIHTRLDVLEREATQN
jgi:hypothetical protein